MKIIDFAAYRDSGLIVERVPVDVRIQFAAEVVERRMFAMAEAAMEGRLPGRFTEQCIRPSDTEESA